MCGRYTFFEVDKLYERFGVNKEGEELAASYNVTPGRLMPVITKESPAKVRLMKWGLVPFWAKDPTIGYRLINARAETVADKPAYRKAYTQQRCLVPANGFYEWAKEDGKQPYYFFISDEPLIAMAGLWDRWHDAEGKEILTYTILTTKANRSVAPVHERMPVVLEQKDEAGWLEPDRSKEKLTQFLERAKKRQFNRYRISMAVNDPKNDDERLINPTND